MRSVLTAIVVVGLLAAPGLAELNVQVTADKTTLAIGEQVTIRILAQGSSSGLAGVAGGILASNPATLQAVAGSFQWAPAFASTVDFPQVGGSAAAGGGWSGFGSMQTGWPPGACSARTNWSRWLTTASRPFPVRLRRSR